MNKPIFTLISLMVFCMLSATAQVAVNNTGTAANTKAMLDISSTSKGLLLPRMTQGERDAMGAVPVGLIVFNTSANSLQYHNGAAWINISNSSIISGTNNKIPKFSGFWGLGNGLMTDDGAGVSLNTSGANPNTSAMLDISSSNKGLLIPRTSSTSRTGIANPAKGLMLCDTSTNSFWFHNGTAWAEIGAGGNGGQWAINGSNISNTNSGYVGINKSSPAYRLDVGGTIHTDFSLNADGNLFVDGSGSIGSSLLVQGNITGNGGLTLENDMVVQGNKGIVRSTSSTQMKMRRTSIGLATTLAAGASATSGYLSFGDDFTAVTVIVGNCRNSDATGGDWEKVFIVPFDIDYVNDRCRFKATNVSNASITFDANWDIVLFGTGP